MAEIDTSIYRQNPQDPLKQPLAILQLLGAVNQNKLQNMDIAGKQGIADVYSRKPFPAADELARAAGVHAPAAVGQQISNTTNQFGLDTAQTKYAQDTLAPLGAKKDLSDKDMSMWSANAVRNGVNPKTISGILDDVRGAKTPDEKRKAILNHGIMSMGTGGLEGTAGAPDEEGRITDVPKARAIIERAAGSQPRVTTNAPGYQEAAVAGAGQRADMRRRAETFGADMYPMTQLLSKIEALGPQGVGPGTQELNTMKSFVQSNLNWLPGADKIIGDPSKIQNYDEAAKYATNLAGARAAQYGHGTDQAMATSLVGSPNTHISQLAGADLTKAIIGLRRMDQIMALEADAKNVPEGKTGAWAAKFATNVDPRALMIDKMNSEQLQNLNKSIKTPAERAKFNKTVQMAIEHGVMTRPGGEHAPGE